MVRCFLPIGRIFSSQIRDSYMRFSHFSQFPASFFMLLDLSGCPDELLNMEFTLGFMQWGEGNCCLEWLLSLNIEAHVSISTSMCSYSSPPLRRSGFLLENDRTKTGNEGIQWFSPAGFQAQPCKPSSFPIMWNSQSLPFFSTNKLLDSQSKGNDFIPLGHWKTPWFLSLSSIHFFCHPWKPFLSFSLIWF